jgi:hypothetical protein
MGSDAKDGFISMEVSVLRGKASLPPTAKGATAGSDALHSRRAVRGKRIANTP